MMKNILKTVIFALVFAAFTSCSSPLDRVYNEDTIMEDLQVIVARNNVSKQEMENLAYYIISAQLSGINLEGKTYRQLIEEANKFAEAEE